MHIIEFFEILSKKIDFLRTNENKNFAQLPLAFQDATVSTLDVKVGDKTQTFIAISGTRPSLRNLIAESVSEYNEKAESVAEYNEKNGHLPQLGLVWGMSQESYEELKQVQTNEAPTQVGKICAEPQLVKELQKLYARTGESIEIQILGQNNYMLKACQEKKLILVENKSCTSSCSALKGFFHKLLEKEQELYGKKDRPRALSPSRVITKKADMENLPLVFGPTHGLRRVASIMKRERSIVAAQTLIGKRGRRP